LTPAFPSRQAAGSRLARQIAKTLALPLQVAPVSKILFPWTTEGGFGAVAFDGSVWIDHAAVASYGLKDEQVAKASADARAKVERRRASFSSAPLPVKGKAAILVDDGIARGSTMRAAVIALRSLGPRKVVVAVPTGHERSIEALRELADEVVCADIRGGSSFAVADAYEDWHDLTDDEIETMLKP